MILILVVDYVDVARLHRFCTATIQYGFLDLVDFMTLKTTGIEVCTYFSV